MEVIIGLVILIIVFVLYEKRFLRKRKAILFKHKKTPKKFRASYKLYDCFDYYHFQIQKGKTVTIYYDVFVEKGYLKMEWKDAENSFFQQEFYQDEKGSFTIVTNRRLHSLRLEGIHTKGGCNVTIEHP